MNTKTHHSPAFKIKVIEDMLLQSYTIEQAARKHEVAPRTLLRWKRDYIDGRLTACHRDLSDTSSLHARISALEKLVGRLTLDNELLKKNRREILRGSFDDSSCVLSESSEESDEDAE